MSNSARRKIVEMYGRIAELERQNAELVKALRDVIGWVPGPQAWHTNEPQKAIARAREVLAAATQPEQGDKNAN